MRYQDLKEFISRRMRMSHIYQPVMLMALLRHDGKRTVSQVAREILRYDESQVEYYEQITNNMVGRVLRNHGIVEKQEDTYVLTDMDRLSSAQKNELVQLCKERLENYLQRRGERVFAHRRISAGYISGTLRYEVLKAAKFRCELCGMSGDERALEVDHILPRKRGGSDELSNLQALCFSCNSMKRDRDDTDFRAVRNSYELREKNCLFCTIPKARVIARNELGYAVEDAYPVTPMHALVIPHRHVTDYFELGRPEINACNKLLATLRERAVSADPTIQGFNIGVNCGEAAGQSIFHCHIHLIPRRTGDVVNARGGVRHLIPGQGDYGHA